ncbi:hypothetical protein O9993_04820 [Vibrio lentus]|nr:hypothetical protein [Vibrio lentus]
MVIEEENKINLPDLSRTPSRRKLAATPFGDKSQKYNKKAIKQGLLSEDEKLAYWRFTRLLRLLSQVIVQSLSRYLVST